MRAAVLAPILAACIAGCATQEPISSDRLNAESTSEVSNHQERARIHTQLAVSYMELGNMGVALEEVKAALAADPNYAPAFNVGGLVYARLNEDSLAEQSFRRALAINPNDSDAHHNYGAFLCSRNRMREAIEHFLTAVRNPLYASPDRSYVNAGVCARRAGDLKAATEHFQAALKARPGQAQALYQLADMAYARRDYATAKRYLNELAQVGVTTAEVLWLGARVERQLGNRNAEASYARQLTNRYPDSAEVRALRAGRYE